MNKFRNTNHKKTNKHIPLTSSQGKSKIINLTAIGSNPIGNKAITNHKHQNIKVRNKKQKSKKRKYKLNFLPLPSSQVKPKLY